MLSRKPLVNYVDSLAQRTAVREVSTYAYLMRRANVMSIVLAGGEGKRLMPLTTDRAKPAVPFGGVYRLIDFALSNVVNSHLRKIVVLTQYKSHSLDLHVTKTWRMSTLLEDYVTPVPAQQRMGKNWYLGSADAIYQSMNLINDEQPDYVVVVGADHVYRMDFNAMVEHHINSGAGCTVAAIRQPISLADQFGVIAQKPGQAGMIGEFLEKPQKPVGLDDSPDEILASMGNYIFTTEALLEAVIQDADNPDSQHDMGGDIVPWFVERGDAAVYDYRDNDVPGSTPRDRDYWRDVGTIDSYYDAHMDLAAIHPVFNLYNTDWPIFTSIASMPPAKFVHGESQRSGMALNSLVSPGAVISGTTVESSILSPNVRVHSWAAVHECVLLENVRVGQHCQLKRTIIDKNVVVPDGTRIGFDREHDLARGFHVTDSGITVIGKNTVLDPGA